MGAAAGVKFVAGGTTLIDPMKLHVERPTTIVEINSLPLDKVERTTDGGLKIGAMVRNSDLAHDATQVQGAQGPRSVPIDEFYLVPGATPQCKNVLAPGVLAKLA